MKSQIRIPNLFVPGAAKSATSSLHDYLNQHPDIYMSGTKEPHFFCHDDKYIGKRDWYFDLFKDAAEYRYRGESSTGYMVFPHVIERIKETIENSKFIFILRNPIERAFSHYLWVKSFGAENRPFKEAVLADFNDEPNPNNSFGFGYKYYYQFGLYGKWLKRFYDSFDHKNILVFTTESLRTDYKTALNSCFQFLELETMDNIEKMISNKTIHYKNPVLLKKLKRLYGLDWIPVDIRKKIPVGIRDLARPAKKKSLIKIEQNAKRLEYPKISDLDRQWLKEQYANDVVKLEKVTGLKFTEWKDFVH